MMTPRASLLAVWLIVFPASLCNAQTAVSDPHLHALILQGIDFTWRQQYAEADSVFQVVTREFPDYPAGYVYGAGVMQSKAIDHELQIDVPRFDSLIGRGEEKAKHLIAAGHDAKWGHFFLATAEGFDSYARVYRDDWVGGTLKGFASASDFKDVIKLDSALYDAYAGIGAFYYWRSRKTEYFNWLPFVGDDRPEALTSLKKTVEKGVYNRYTAMSMLVTIYIDAGSYDNAVMYAKIGLERYPSSQIFLWGLSTALQKLGRLTETAEAYKELLRSILREREENRYNEVVCRLNLARTELELGDSSQAREHLSSILQFHATDFPTHMHGRVQDKLEQARTLIRRLREPRTSNE